MNALGELVERPRTVRVLGTPAAAAMPARSLPVDVAVGKPPTDSRLSLSKTTWIEVARPVARQRRQAAEVHQDRSVAVEDDDLLLRPRQRDPEPHRRRQAHRMLQVEEVRPVPDRLQLRRHGAHDGHDDAVVECG